MEISTKLGPGIGTLTSPSEVGLSRQPLSGAFASSHPFLKARVEKLEKMEKWVSRF
ncbi:unnamed protein product [Dovyalis caffra]|uniref:Uncharacterized protein n=1 Tax=Dovyalis caffra TaxID=77055 RepID=A0AAV1SVE6_9ROSI|nr:unnamed protein product [Dovyalis caffra]